MIRWRGRRHWDEEQVANAPDDFPDLTPVSPIPALLIKSDWAALLPGQAIPLIGERRHGREADR